MSPYIQHACSSFIELQDTICIFVSIDVYINSWTVGYMASKKTTSGNRLDVGWQYGMDVDKNSRRVQCNYCQKIINGGINHFKHY